MNGSKIEVLIVEDDEATAELEQRALLRNGFGVTIARTLVEALAHLEHSRPSAIVLDFSLGSTPAWPVLEAGATAVPAIPVIMVTAMGDERVASEAIQRGAVDYVIKTGGYIQRLIQSADNAIRVARAEQALQQMEALQSAILESVDARIALLDESGRVILVNGAWARFVDRNELPQGSYGVGCDYIATVESEQGVDPESARLHAAGLRSVLEGRSQAFSMEYAWRVPPEERWFRFDIQQVRHVPKRGAVVMLVDITERVLAEESRLQNASLLQSILQSVDEGVLVVDAGGSLLKWNRAATEILGLDPGDRTGPLSAWLRVIPGEPGIPDGDEEFPLAEALTGVVVTERELAIADALGRPVYISVIARPMRDSSGEITGAVATFRDISERVSREGEMRRIAAAVHQTADAVIITDTMGRIEYVNPAFESMYGFDAEEVRGASVSIVKSNEQDTSTYVELWKSLRAGKTWSGRLINRTKRNMRCVADVTITPVLGNAGNIRYYVATQRDVTSQVVMEMQLRQSQKMEAIGVLAGGIAHDFNNILAAIDGYAHMAAEVLDKSSAAYDDLTYVIRGAERAKALVRKILTFSRQSDASMKPLYFDRVILDALELMRATLPATISLNIDITFKDALVHADETQLQQIIVNLCTNGAQAVRERGGGLEVRLSKCALRADSELISEFGLVPGDYACLEVEDEGMGIPAKFIERIFDPFFSTKKEDGGTGLGLSTVLGIVRGHRGAISVRSTTGKGTTFFVYLPVSHADTQPDTRPRRSRTPRGNGQHVLVVDDETAIATLSGRMLDSLGYRSTVFNDAGEALKAFSAAPDSFDVILTDLTMPGMTGDQLARSAREVRPAIPIILLSGFTEGTELASEFVSKVLAKPARLAELALALKMVLKQ